MPHKYYVFTSDSESSTPLDATVLASHDTGWQGQAVPATDPQGRAGQVFDIPDSVPDKQGCQLDITMDAYTPLKLRGVLTYVDDRAYLECDDFRLVKLPPPPEPPPVTPPPVTGGTPLEIIQGVHNSGNYNLATKTGCGEFTEECCRQLAAAYGPMWGHVAKIAGQNQYNNHAVDALYALYGNDAGVWDIIYSSVSSNAKPAFNDAGTGRARGVAPACADPRAAGGDHDARRGRECHRIARRSAPRAGDLESDVSPVAWVILVVLLFVGTTAGCVPRRWNLRAFPNCPDGLPVEILIRPRVSAGWGLRLFLPARPVGVNGHRVRRKPCPPRWSS